MAETRSVQDKQQINNFRKLPLEVLMQVFSRLPIDDLLRLLSVDKVFSNAKDKKTLWEEKVLLCFPDEHQTICNANINNIVNINWYDHCKKLCDRQYKDVWVRCRDDNKVKLLMGQIFAFKENDLERFTIKEDDPESIKAEKYRDICILARQPEIIKWIEKHRCSQEMLDFIFKASEYFGGWKSHTLQDIRVLCNQIINNEKEYLEYLNVNNNWYKQLEIAARFDRQDYIDFIQKNATEGKIIRFDMVKAQSHCLSSACEGGQLDLVKKLLKNNKIDITSKILNFACSSGSFDLVNFIWDLTDYTPTKIYMCTDCCSNEYKTFHVWHGFLYKLQDA